MVLVGVSLMEVVKHLSIVKKTYWKFKYFESKASENAAIRKAIDQCMDNFCFDKGLMIKSILDCPFCKVVLDYLVVNDELKRLDPRGLVSYWFTLAADFISKRATKKVISVSNHVPPVLNVLNSKAFVCVCGGLLEVWSNCIEVYTDGSLKDAGLTEIASGTAAYFLAIDMGIGIRVQRLFSSTLAELQAIALVLKCILFSCSVVLYLDSQSVIDACVSESLVMVPDFHN
ncbi:hypothetical protein G9A89_009650 [Geosiphon pyriformis]|nr:hypothetical protein G9A89_009650 [Geosiphon pyriformis]